MDQATLQPGQTVLHYRIGDKIGEGGMGEVWRATDTELGRDVAIKVLPTLLSNDGERLARFEREARLLASLNHPHIATIHGLHEAETDKQKFRFLVMELVEGDDLIEAAVSGITFDRAIEIAIQIARALEAAHSSGIVHRDLKPANVKLTASQEVKVLDFGLAKAVGLETESGSGVGPTMSPTITSAGTVAGTILGTAAYMSPEQARGRTVDRRADMWAFGCLLFELLTGKRAFEGETISDTLASVLKETPDWDALPAETPAGIRRLLRRCLEKDRRRRWSDAGDARLEMEEALQPEMEEPSAVTAPAAEPVAAKRRLLPWILAGAGLLVAAVALLQGVAPEPTPGPLLRLTIPLPDGLRIEDEQTGNVALSPTGRHIVFTGRDEKDQTGLYLRALASNDVTLLEGTQNGENPFFSPDGEWIGFHLESRLMKISIAGGVPIEICKDVGQSRGAAWGEDGRIYFPRHFDSGLWVVAESGGTAEELIPLNEETRERTHRWPQAVPGQGVLLFTVATKDSPEYYDDARIDAFDLDTGYRKTVFEGASYARYVSSGHLVFGRNGSLWAVPFDIETLETTGKQVPLEGTVRGLRNSGVVYMGIAEGMLLYIEGEQQNELRRYVMRRGLDGSREPVESIGVSGTIGIAASHDGTRIATGTAGASTHDVWVHDLRRGTRTRLTFEGDNAGPVWSGDDAWVYYSSVRDGLGMVYRKRSDGTGDEELVYRQDGVTVTVQDVSDDRILYTRHGDPISLYAQKLDELDSDPRPLFDTPFQEDLAAFSPDGRWVAYTTNESGSFDIFVKPADGGPGQWQISTEGGVVPRWSQDGSKLFFRISRQVWVVDVDTNSAAGAFRSSTPRLLLTDTARARFTSWYDVSADGKSLLLPEPVTDEAPLDRFHMLVNWFDEIERLAPAE